MPDLLKAAQSAVAALAIALISVASAHAETASDRNACIPSVLRLCPREALFGDRDGATRCLFARLAEASPACQAVVRGDPAPVAEKAPAPPTRQAFARAG